MGRRGRGLLAGSLVWLALVPGTAAARVLHAKDVLPPGQSGFVSTAGLANGTGSPHLTDQIDLFNNFLYKPETFNQAGTTETPMAGVKIVRDSYGVPAVTGDTEYDGWWGVGYAVAQDRLFQLEIFRRATNGTLAAILGSSYLNMDLIDRRDYYTNSEMDAQLAKLPQPLVSRMGAYRDGVNAWIDHVNASPADMPGEFPALGDLPIAPWTVRDSARIGVYLARTVPSGDGSELDNARGLNMIGRSAFKRLIPLRGKGRRTTIPASEGTFSSQPGRSRHDERIGFRRSAHFMKHSDYLSAAADAQANPTFARASTSAAPLQRLLKGPGGSFMWAIRDRKHSRAYLYNGPQLGFSIPELFVEFELHSPGEPNLRGVSAAGVPVVGIGLNKHVTWGFTSGLTDDNDLYVEKLTGQTSYRFRGHSRQMSCRDETFTWRPPPTSLPGLVTDPGQPAGSRTVPICRTVHGPVQLQADGFAFSRRYSIWQRDLQTLIGIDKLNHAADIHGVDRAMRKVTWNENVIAADDQGNIGYWHPGLHPLRPRTWDERLPFPGTGSAEWRGLLPRRHDPHVINPAQGWLASWNNFPSIGWTSGDAPARERLDGPLHRVHWLQYLVGRVARNPSYEASTNIVKRSGTFAQQRHFLDAGKVTAAIGLSSTSAIGRRTLRALLAWRGSYARTDSGGTVDPGVAIWEELKSRLEGVLFHRLGPGASHLTEPTSLSHQFDTTNGESLALRTLGARQYARAAEQAAANLTQRFSTTDVSAWREPRRMYNVPAQGAGSSPDLPFFDRGTWNQSVSLGP